MCHIIKPSMSPKAIPCGEKVRLIAELESAHHEIVALGDEEVRLVRRGELNALRELEVQQLSARKRRDRAMRAIRQHIAEHGC